MYNLLGCRGPLQTYRSSRGEQKQDPDIIIGQVKLGLNVPNVLRGNAFNRRLSGRSLTAAIEIEERRDKDDSKKRAED